MLRTSAARAMWFGIAIGLLIARAHAADRPGTTQPVAIATTEAVWTDDARHREVPVKIYFPKDAAGPLPVIIFSHGLGGTREGYSYLGKYWSARGYVVVHLQHHGSDREAVAAGGTDVAKDPQRAVDRDRDVSFAIDRLTQLNADPDGPLHGRLDLARIGMAGHSFGGGTTMAVAGQVSQRGRSFAEPRVKCAVAMSAPEPIRRDNLDAVFAPITMPVFALTGTEDDSPVGETKAADRRLGFDHLLHGPAFLLTFAGGDHALFSGRNRSAALRPDDPRDHLLIQRGTTAFFDAYLRGDAPAKKWFIGGGFAADIADAGKFEMKNP